MFPVIEEIAQYLRSACTTNFTTYYLGEVETDKIPGDYLPALSIYGLQTSLSTAQLTTARDKYGFRVQIKVVINAFAYVNDAEETNSGDSNLIELQAPKALYTLVEERDANMKPVADSILGALRANVQGIDYLYNNEITIEYPRGNKPGTQYMEALITIGNISKYNTR